MKRAARARQFGAAVALSFACDVSSAHAQSVADAMLLAFGSSLNRYCDYAFRADELGLRAIEAKMSEQATKLKDAAGEARVEWEGSRTEVARLRNEINESTRGRGIAPDTAGLQSELGTAVEQAKSARKQFVRVVSAAVLGSTLETLVGECVERRRRLLAEGGDSGLTQGLFDPSDAPSPSAGDEDQCVALEGPLGCTGTFNGTYDLDCGSTAPRDNGTGYLVVKRDGSAEVVFRSSVRRESDPPRVVGTLDYAGRMVIQKQSEGIDQRWDGTFARSAIGEGRYKLVGNGRYFVTVSGSGGDVYLDCVGTFQLGGPGGQ